MDVPGAIHYLQQEKPAFIAIGNSMLFTRLGKSPDEMTKLTGEPFAFLLKAGSSSAIWYLMLKNVVAASGVKPKAVFLFVRDDELTVSLANVEGNDLPFLLSLRGADEPELDRMMGRPDERRGFRPVSRLKSWILLDQWQEETPARFADLAMDIGGRGMQKKIQRTIMNERFGLEHLRGDVKADKEAGGTFTASMLGADFRGTPLDEMLKVAEKNSLRLAVVRIKRRPNANGVVEDDSPGMRDYVAKLKTVIEKRGGVFLDDTYEPSLRLSDYLDGDHLRPERQDWYRKYFWTRMAPLLE